SSSRPPPPFAPRPGGPRPPAARAADGRPAGRSARPEALSVAEAERRTVAGLVVGPRPERLVIAGIGLFQLTLAVEVPALVAAAVLAAGGAALRHPPFVAGAIGRALLRHVGGRRP